MANTPSGLRLLGIGNYSYTIKLGKAATISVKTERINEDTYSRKQTWELSYNVNKMTSTVSIVKTTTEKKSDEEICISIKDYLPEGNLHYKEMRAAAVIPPINSESFFIRVRKDEAGLLQLFSRYSCNYKEEADYIKNRRTSEGLNTGTSFFAYGCGTRIGLFVKDKKKSNEERPYMLTVAHYYVNSVSGGNSRVSGLDVGFSVVMKIGVHNGVLDFSVDGPVEHPTSALIYMIEEVTRTGTWKLSACPHCKNNQWKQRRWLSESEDSDTPLPPPRCGGSQNAANMGQFNGDGNGSFIKANKVNFNKWWK
ncbi:hypothetical protein VNO80_12339 [Phaseolus coccineus]|uniref:Uncharacterized protein n=1 Tax=Phaseolus coccineus TaxID=3886 RepID=A0AAN9N0D3_PHACN